MADILSTSERSIRMSAVRQHGTSPELRLRRALRAVGLAVTTNVAGLPGRPDLVIRSAKLAVFVHGCFWHGHGCRAGRAPASRADYWVPKIQENRRRDRRKADALRRSGWHVMAIWQCRMATDRGLVRELRRVARIAGG